MGVTDGGGGGGKEREQESNTLGEGVHGYYHHHQCSHIAQSSQRGWSKE